MTDERTGRELTPRPDEEPSAISPREPALPAPSTGPAERFSAGEQAHTVGLTEERATQIVRSSSNARMVAFLSVLLLVLFIPLYWLYDIGLPFVGYNGRLDNEAAKQYVTDVARGNALFLANCARCHGALGQGGIGPPLNDQGKLFQAVRGDPPNYTSGTGHLNPDYIRSVLTEGGRYVCGDPKSVMPAWLQPKGPLNYREVEEIIKFIVASNETTWVYQPSTGESLDATPAPAVVEHGWRDPNYTQPPGSTPVPDCWRATPAPSAGATASPAAVASPGTPESPRTIDVVETGGLTITDTNGTQLTQIAVVPGETVTFTVTNSAGFDHDFYIGPGDKLQANAVDGLPGAPIFQTGSKGVTWTVPADVTGLQFACTVPGHYGSMHGNIVAASSGAGGSALPSGTPAPSGTP